MAPYKQVWLALTKTQAREAKCYEIAYPRNLFRSSPCYSRAFKFGNLGRSFGRDSRSYEILTFQISVSDGGFGQVNDGMFI